MDLQLGVVSIPTSGERLAWIAGWIKGRQGPGIVYCLTVSEVERTASFLASCGISAAAYTAVDRAESEARRAGDERVTPERVDAAHSALRRGVAA